MVIDKCYFTQLKKRFLHLYIQPFYCYMHFLHILLILLLGTPPWSETCRILPKNNSRGLLINNIFCWFWARSRSLAKKQLALSCPSVHLSVRPSVRPSIFPSVHPSVCPSVRLSTRISPAPTGRIYVKYYTGDF